jgi:DNA-binding transcriptional regulator YhcF (GntR family)
MSTPYLVLTGAGALPSRTVAVLDAIKHAILAGELKPGQPLVETDLAEVLGVSKTPVREALKTLAGAGLVTMSPYKGAAVRVVDDEQARHVYDARLLLEPEAVARAVTRGHDWGPAHEALARADSAADQAGRGLANRDFPRCWSACSMTCAIRPPWSAWRPGTANRAGWRSRAGSTRRPSTGPYSRPRMIATPSARRSCSATTSPPSSRGISLKSQEKNR